MIGVLNINKPRGITSSQVVVKIKKLLGIKKAGHMGTLDPLASGVLPICVGKATRLFDYFLKKQKTYIATFKFGEETTTLDSEGEIVKTSDIIPSVEQLERTIKTFLGEINQIPPIYSSKKIDGKKAYDLARAGKKLELKPCKVCIYNYKLLKQIDNKTFEFLITCSAGTYIRALARDLGNGVKSCATMINLIRIKSGNFDIKDSVDFDNLTKEILINNLIPLNLVLADFEKILLTNQDFQKLLNGQLVKIGCTSQEKSLNENLNYVIVVEEEIKGIGYLSNGILKMKTYLDDN